MLKGQSKIITESMYSFLTFDLGVCITWCLQKGHLLWVQYWENQKRN